MAIEVVTAVLVDEDALFRRGLRDLLEASGVEVLGEAPDAEAAMPLAGASSPDVIVLDAGGRRAPTTGSVGRLYEAAPTAAVLVLAASLVPDAVVDAIRAGAAGYLLKEAGPEGIVTAVQDAAGGGSPLSPAVAALLLEQLRTAPRPDRNRPDLTARERHILARLAAGSRNSEIADELSISTHTVKRHVSHLLAKLGVENRTQAAVEATRRGLL